jgi:hypothetical protein
MRSIRLISALMLITVIPFLAGLHVYWALAGKWGTFAAVPTIEGRRTIDPTPLVHARCANWHSAPASASPCAALGLNLGGGLNSHHLFYLKDVVHTV